MQTSHMLAAIIAGLLALGSAADAAEPGIQPHNEPQVAPSGRFAIVGSWLVQVTLANCQTGDEIPGATFQALNTFLREGSMLSDPASNPAQSRTGHGVWSHEGERYFTNTVVLFRFDSAGAYAGTQTVRRNITVAREGSQFTTLDRIVTADAAGTVLDTRCAIGRGRRLEP